MRLSAFCESCFCLIRCWMGVLFHLLPPIPACLSECPLPYQQHASASLSPSLANALPPLSVPVETRPGCHGGQVLQTASSAQAATGHMLHYFALPVHFIVLLWPDTFFFSLFQTLSNIGGILCESALNEKADECMQTGSPNPSRELNPRLTWI